MFLHASMHYDLFTGELVQSVVFVSFVTPVLRNSVTCADSVSDAHVCHSVLNSLWK